MTERNPKVSIIIPVDRPEEGLTRTLESLEKQQEAPSWEVILVGNVAGLQVDGTTVRSVPFDDRNPALRRNHAAALARGEILGFIDDDAAASPRWLETAAAFLDSHPYTVALGGPDPGPPVAPIAERISDMLLAARWIGSGVLCHEGRPGIFAIEKPHDLALVNLFIRRDAFEEAEGFDEAIGYIGEDTALLERLMRMGSVMYHDGCVVHHRRRPYPMAYLAQRWRYRVKTGLMLATGRARMNSKIAMFLTAGTLFVGLLMFSPRLAAGAFVAYCGVCLYAGISTRRVPVFLWPFIPLFFLTHHTTYFAGIMVGAARGLVMRLRGPVSE